MTVQEQKQCVYKIDTCIDRVHAKDEVSNVRHESGVLEALEDYENEATNL